MFALLVFLPPFNNAGVDGLLFDFVVKGVDNDNPLFFLAAAAAAGAGETQDSLLLLLLLLEEGT